MPGASCTIGVQYVVPATGGTTGTAHVTVSGVGLGAATQASANFTAN